MGVRSTQLAESLIRTTTGPMWHGPALAQLLDGISADQAVARPISGAHNIWELVLHITAWAEIVRARVKGGRTEDPAPDQDWPPVPDQSSDEWNAATARLGGSYRALAADVGTLEDQALDQTVPQLEYSVETMLLGVVEHGAYHGGQIALLKRAMGEQRFR